jgi:hypothetical protein
MLLLTASAHWGRRRPDLIATVPRRFTQPGWIVTITGILEIAAAIGLILESMHRAAALSLVVLSSRCFLQTCARPIDTSPSAEPRAQRASSSRHSDRLYRRRAALRALALLAACRGHRNWNHAIKTAYLP